MLAVNVNFINKICINYNYRMFRGENIIFKKRYLFLIMFVSLFLISAVSAEEMDNSTDLISDDCDSNLIAQSIDYSMSEKSDDSWNLSFANYENDSDVLSYVYDARISAPDVYKYYKGSERFTVTLMDSHYFPIYNDLVEITINGNT